MAPFKTHIVRFCDLEPIAIQCMVLNEKKDTLALSRSDSSVELWSVSYTPYLQKSIPGTPEASIESLCWFENRLFSCGLHGFVIEYDLIKLKVKAEHTVTSGPAWCLASNIKSRKIAVGTEEGFVSVFNIHRDTIEFLRILDKQEGRILCLAWNPAGTHLATGSIDTIRTWDVHTGHPTARMTTGRVERNKETIVWAVVVTEDMTVISGDSRGRTSFWNGRNGTLIDSIQSHKADVLTVELNPDGSVAYSSGVDPTIMHFQTISKPDGRRVWVKSLHRVVNTHDVRALVSLKDKGIISGGVDSYLTISNYITKAVTRVAATPRGGISQVAADARVLLLKYRTYLELWRLGDTEQGSGAVGSNLPLSREPVKLVQIMTKDDERIICSTISKDACWVAYCTLNTFRVYQLEGCAYTDGIDADATPRISRLRIKEDIEQPHHLAFFRNKDDENCLLVATETGNLQVYSVTSGGLYSCWSLACTDMQLTTSIHLMAVQKTTAVLADHAGVVVVVDLEKEAVISKLPSYKDATLTAMALSPDNSTCAMVFTNQRVVEVDIKTSKFTSFSNMFNRKLHKDWTARKLPVTELFYISPDLIMMHDDEYIAVLDKEKDIQEPESKLCIVDSTFNTEDSQDGSYISSSPSGSSIRQETVSRNCLRLMKKFYHLVGVHPLYDNHIVCVEVSPSQIESKLPPSLMVKIRSPLTFF
jgi:U3 small nucleolar RNA-associated protein 4